MVIWVVLALALLTLVLELVWAFQRRVGVTTPQRNTSVISTLGSLGPESATPALGCSVCHDPNHFHTHLDSNATLICQSFWHMRYKTWPDCYSNATIFRKKLREHFCELCQTPASAATGTRKQGVVFTGGRVHMDLIRTSIRMLRHLNFRGGVEVFGSAKDMTAFQEYLGDLNVDFRTFKTAYRVGFSYKIGAILQSTFDDVLFLDADNIMVVSPDVLFQDENFLREGMMSWADLWGVKCRSHKWPVANDNPEGVMLCGQSSWPDHIIWPVADLTWQPVRAYSQEMTSSQLLFDKHRHRVALELALFMTESQFIQNVLYGDKDTFRIGLLMHNKGFYMSDEMPGQILINNNQRTFLTSW